MKIFVGIALAFAATQAFASAYDNIITDLAGFVSANREFVSSTTIGRNDQGIDIDGVIIKGPAATEGAVHQLVVGSHHGNERLSVNVAMAFAEQAIAVMKDPTSPYYPALASKVIHVIPVLNIGGYNDNRREEYNGNRSSVDPNRDYPDPCGGGAKFVLASTEALARYLAEQNIIAAVTIHGYIGTFTYPWGTYTDETSTPDHAMYRTIAQAGASISGYDIGTHADVIYPTNGAFEDWAYHALGTWTMLLELDRNSNVPRDAKSLLAFFAAAPTELSAFHEHLGQCRRAKGPILARP